MPLRVRLLALPLALVLGAALGACGSDDVQESAAPVAQPPLTTTQPTTSTATSPTTTTTGTTTVPPSTTTTTTPATTTPTQTVTTPTTTSTQPSGGAPAGCPTAVGGFIRDMRTSGTDCGVARSVATAWFDAVHGGAAPDAPVTAAGYACSATLAGERASVSCTGSGGSVSFTASP